MCSSLKIIINNKIYESQAFLKKRGANKMKKGVKSCMPKPNFNLRPKRSRRMKLNEIIK